MDISNIDRATNMHAAAERAAISKELTLEESTSFGSSEIDLNAQDLEDSISETVSIVVEKAPSIDKSPKKSLSSLSNIASEYRNFSSGDVDPFSTDHDEAYPASDDANEAFQPGNESSSSSGSFSSDEQQPNDVYGYYVMDEEEEEEERTGELEPFPQIAHISPVGSQSEFGLSKVLADISFGGQDDSALPTDLSISGLMSD